MLPHEGCWPVAPFGVRSTLKSEQNTRLAPSTQHQTSVCLYYHFGYKNYCYTAFQIKITKLSLNTQCFYSLRSRDKCQKSYQITQHTYPNFSPQKHKSSVPTEQLMSKTWDHTVVPTGGTRGWRTPLTCNVTPSGCQVYFDSKIQDKPLKYRNVYMEIIVGK